MKEQLDNNLRIRIGHSQRLLNKEYLRSFRWIILSNLERYLLRNNLDRQNPSVLDGEELHHQNTLLMRIFNQSNWSLTSYSYYVDRSIIEWIFEKDRIDWENIEFGILHTLSLDQDQKIPYNPKESPPFVCHLSNFFTNLS